MSLFTKHEHDRLVNVTRDEETMVRTLKADANSDIPYRAALAIYHELLWDSYSRSQLKDVRKRMLLDAKSGKIRMKNKRLYAIPDLYAACEYWFEHKEHPEGLIPAGWIVAKPFKNKEKADVLRSPHLFMEHAIRKIIQNEEVYSWFYTNAVATSCHDLITRILQLDQRSRINTVNQQMLGVQ